jgi:hypothetical protein
MDQLPKIDLKRLKKKKKENFKQRLEFINKYTEWLKKTPNNKWSKQQKEVIDGNKPFVFKSSKKIKYKK